MAGGSDPVRLVCRHRPVRRRAGVRAREAGLSGRADEKAVVPNTVEAARQDMEQEAADELIDRERHVLPPVAVVTTIVRVAEGDDSFVEGDQAAVRDCDPMGVAGQVGEHCLRSRERCLGIGHPTLLPDRREMPQECLPLGEMSWCTEEVEPPGIMQSDQPGKVQPSKQFAEYAHRKQEGRLPQPQAPSRAAGSFVGPEADVVPSVVGPSS